MTNIDQKAIAAYVNPQRPNIHTEIASSGNIRILLWWPQSNAQPRFEIRGQFGLGSSYSLDDLNELAKIIVEIKGYFYG